MNKTVIAAGAALVAALSVSAAHAANLLTNGSFEDTTNFVDQGGDVDELPIGSTAMTGWTVVGDDLSWIGPADTFGLTASPNPGGGSYFLDLTGFHNGSADAGVTQTITTVAGAAYVLSFDLGSAAQYGLQDGVEASAGATSASFTTTNDGTSNNLWQTETLAFTATGSSTLISLVGDAGHNYAGLDNVSVTGGTTVSAAPEPSTWTLMIVALGIVGGWLRRDRRGLSTTATA